MNEIDLLLTNLFLCPLGYLLDSFLDVLARNYETSMMNLTEDFSYFDGEGFTSIEIPYDSRELSMVVIVPDSGQFETFETELSSEKLDEIISGLSSERVALSMPIWTVKPDGIRMKSILDSLGMHDAFSTAEADFSGTDRSRFLYISDVVHKAFVKVNEAGTEAAAATAVVVAVWSSVPPQPIPFAIR